MIFILYRVPAGSTIVIDGKIRMPDNAGTTGNYKIYTYSDTHDTDIRANGNIIDKSDSVRFLTNDLFSYNLKDSWYCRWKCTTPFIRSIYHSILGTLIYSD